MADELTDEMKRLINGQDGHDEPDVEEAEHE